MHSNKHGAATAQHSNSKAWCSASYLEEAILSQCHKSNGRCGDEHAGNGDEAADEDKQAQQANARDLQYPHAQDCQCSVGHGNLRLQCTDPQLLLHISEKQ